MRNGGGKKGREGERVITITIMIIQDGDEQWNGVPFGLDLTLGVKTGGSFGLMA